MSWYKSDKKPISWYNLTEKYKSHGTNQAQKTKKQSHGTNQI